MDNSYKDQLYNLGRTMKYLFMEIDHIKISQGKILSELNKKKNSKNIQDYEFKIFSQWGEDGIIQKIIDSIEIKNKTFIEFGVGDFFESNCRFLMMHNNWSGFVIDSSEKMIEMLKKTYFYWKYNLKSINAFIYKENINNLLLKSEFDFDLGLLSIDIDGNDYYILEAISQYKPRILVVEYNSLFGSKRNISIPYTPDFNRTKANYSNLYFGASLGAITYIAKKKGYILVGSNSSGVNAFYVRKDLMNKKLNEKSVKEAYTISKLRESRDESGRLSYLAEEKRLKAIKGTEVFNVINKKKEIL
tara:strand:+ start:206 stop:1114 length:909 start_codon:yes stop_codon:yes gene_type:complete